MDKKKRARFIKKLLYQSCYRGCKETDLIIGKFAKENVAKMSGDDLEIFSRILSLADGDIYDWYTGKKPVPDQNKSNILTQILNFDPSK